jgi:crotonobetainyl-CoA:carnitine CoA-transferase CaiB-like acyl-CoA transferase
VSIERIGEAAPKPWPRGDRPLAGLRVLDLSRVIAGPVAGRTLAAHGADVLLISGPDLPAIPWLAIDTGRGKLTSFVELKSEQGRETLRGLLASADIFSQGYRPRALAALGFAPQDAAKLNPGIVYVSLSAYGHAGPWAERRGFDSLVQTATGFNHAEGQAAGVGGPKELPAQMLDHATGYLMAFGAAMAKARQAREGGSWHVRVSLARTGRWLSNLGRVADGLETEDLTGDAVSPFIEELPSGFGRLRSVSHSAVLSKTPAFWARPAMPLGSHPPQWPPRG